MKVRLEHLKIRYLIQFAVVTLILTVYQNCGQGFSPVHLNSHGTGLDVREKPQKKVLVGNRFLISSVFVDLFLPNGSHLNNCNAIGDPELKDSCNDIRDRVFRASDIYGGNCTPTDGKEHGCYENTTETNQVVEINVAREGGRVTTCRSILERNSPLFEFLGKAGLDQSSQLNLENLEKAYELFYQGYTLDAQAIADLQWVADTQKDNIEKWRMVVLTLCESPGWAIH
jgi:hypothetical protein